MSLILENVTKSYGDKVVVDNLSFSINEPGAFGLIGTNGAGKTTTIRMILSVTSMGSGSITWYDKPITRESVRFGYMPEERGIYAKTKIIDQLVYFGRLRGMTKNDAIKSADRWLERMQATQYRDVLAETLSKGNQQKIQFIATVIHDPVLLFLDEPFSGFDPVNADVFDKVILELINDNKYVIMSSHQMSSVEKYCRDIVMLHEGKSILKGDLKEIKAGYGYTRLAVGYSEKDKNAIINISENIGLKYIEETPQLLSFEITNKKQPKGFLGMLVEKDIYPIHYDVREPTLHEIFVEKVGEVNEKH